MTGYPSALNSALLAESVYPYEVRTGQAESIPGDGPDPAIYEPLGAELVAWIDDRDSGTQVAVFRWPDGTYEVAARGTDSLQDWRANLRSRFSPRGWMRLWEHTEARVVEAIPQERHVGLRLGGHSLGGQLARCGARALSGRFGRPHVITFGAPRGCTRAQRRQLEETCTGERYESPLDPVTWLPRRLPLLGGSGARSPFIRQAVKRIATPTGSGLANWCKAQHSIGNYVAALSAQKSRNP
jgi:hypothetical protein